MTINDYNCIKIAVAGHTSVGKTTLIRTLMKSKVGEIADKANVTKDKGEYTYQGLQAKFIDCPGFQNALLLLSNPKLIDNNKVEGVFVPKNCDLTYDRRAIKAIVGSDVVLYVASLEAVPDNSHEMELNFIQTVQPNIVAILSKSHKNKESCGNEVVNGRISQFKSFLIEEGVKDIIEFDAHWDKPAKVNLIYDSIKKLIPNERRDIFEIGLNSFYARQKGIKDKVSEMYAKFIFDIKRIEVRIKQTPGKDDQIEEELQKKIFQEIVPVLNSFLKSISFFYELVTDDPITSPNEFDVKYEKSTDLKDVITSSSIGATVTGSISGVIGAGVGAFFTGIFSGGLAAGPGAILGAQIGASLGGVVGSLFGGLVGTGQQCKVQVNDSHLNLITDECISIIWALSHHGYGLSSHILEQQIDGLKANLNQIYQIAKPIKLSIAEEQDIRNWFSKVLDLLDDI